MSWCVSCRPALSPPLPQKKYLSIDGKVFRHLQWFFHDWTKENGGLIQKSSKLTVPHRSGQCDIVIKICYKSRNVLCNRCFFIQCKSRKYRILIGWNCIIWLLCPSGAIGCLHSPLSFVSLLCIARNCQDVIQLLFSVKVFPRGQSRVTLFPGPTVHYSSCWTSDLNVWKSESLPVTAHF